MQRGYQARVRVNQKKHFHHCYFRKPLQLRAVHPEQHLSTAVASCLLPRSTLGDGGLPWPHSMRAQYSPASAFESARAAAPGPSPALQVVSAGDRAHTGREKHWDECQSTLTSHLFQERCEIKKDFRKKGSIVEWPFPWWDLLMREEKKQLNSPTNHIAIYCLNAKSWPWA